MNFVDKFFLGISKRENVLNLQRICITDISSFKSNLNTTLLNSVRPSDLNHSSTITNGSKYCIATEPIQNKRPSHDSSLKAIKSRRKRTIPVHERTISTRTSSRKQINNVDKKSKEIKVKVVDKENFPAECIHIIEKSTPVPVSKIKTNNEKNLPVQCSNKKEISSKYKSDSNILQNRFSSGNIKPIPSKCKSEDIYLLQKCNTENRKTATSKNSKYKKDKDKFIDCNIASSGNTVASKCERKGKQKIQDDCNTGSKAINSKCISEKQNIPVKHKAASKKAIASKHILNDKKIFSDDQNSKIINNTMNNRRMQIKEHEDKAVNSDPCKMSDLNTCIVADKGFGREKEGVHNERVQKKSKHMKEDIQKDSTENFIQSTVLSESNLCKNGRKSKKTLKYLKQRHEFLKDHLSESKADDDLFESSFGKKRKNICHLIGEDLAEPSLIKTPRVGTAASLNSAITPRTTLLTEWGKNTANSAVPFTPTDPLKTEKEKAALQVIYHHMNEKKDPPKNKRRKSPKNQPHKTLKRSLYEFPEISNRPRQKNDDSSFDDYFDQSV